MHRYMVDLTNPEDQEGVSPTGFSSGRHGFTVRAPDMAAALAAAVERSRAQGIYGQDWRARVVRLGPGGPVSPGTKRDWTPADWAGRAEAEAHLLLRDDAGPLRRVWGPGTPLPGGVWMDRM